MAIVEYFVLGLLQKISTLLSSFDLNDISIEHLGLLEILTGFTVLFLFLYLRKLLLA